MIFWCPSSFFLITTFCWIKIWVSLHRSECCSLVVASLVCRHTANMHSRYLVTDCTVMTSWLHRWSPCDHIAIKVWNETYHSLLSSLLFFPASCLHAMGWLGLGCVSAKTVGVVLVGKGRQVLWGAGHATQIWLHWLFMHGHTRAIREAIQWL